MLTRVRPNAASAAMIVMWAAGPVKQTYPLLSTPELDQARRLMSLAQSPVVQLKTEGLELSLRKNG